MVWWNAVSNTATFLSARIGEGFQRFRDADQVSWVVQWCKRHGIFDTLQNFVVDHGRSGELLAAVHDAVADSGQLRGKLWFCARIVLTMKFSASLCAARPQRRSFVFGAVHFPMMRASGRWKHSAKPERNSSPLTASMIANFREELPQLGTSTKLTRHGVPT